IDSEHPTTCTEAWTHLTFSRFGVDGTGGAPRRSAGECGGNDWILLALHLRRQLQLGEVGRGHIKGQTGATANGPFATSRWIISEAESRREVIGVRFGGAEEEPLRRIIRDGVARLQVIVARNST